MINIRKEGRRYIMTIVDKAKQKIEYQMDWEEMARLFCQVAEQVCKYIGKKK